MATNFFLPTAEIARVIQEHIWVLEPDTETLARELSAQFSLSHSDTRLLLYHVIRNVNKALFPPLTQMELVLTEGCNLNCAYCFEKEMIGVKSMPTHIALQAVDMLFDYSANRRKLRITFFGGEPTLNFAVIKQVVRYVGCKQRTLKKSVEYHMTSNGVLIDEAMARFFGQYNIMVLLSIDGLKDSHDRFRIDRRGKGTFDIVIQNMKVLQRYQPWIGTKITVMPENAGLLYEDVKGLNELGINHFIIGAASGVDWSEEATKVLSSNLVRIRDWYRVQSRTRVRIPQLDEKIPSHPVFGCQAGRNSICVTPDGDISPCARVLALQKEKLLAHLGNLRFGLYRLLNRRELVECDQLLDNCHSQGIAERFSGGCFAANFEETGNLFQPSVAQYRMHQIERCAEAINSTTSI